MTAGVDEIGESVATPWTMAAAVYASGWVARHTFVPVWAKDALAVVLVGAPVAAAVLLARRTDAFELTGGRCRARNRTDGRRCANSRDAGADLCGTHQNTHDVDLHPTALEDAVDRDAATRSVDKREKNDAN
ncbi:hypothetical protein C475_14463 [Halosimplex carlsbadense 2-9-1]|uniref:Uncharacterized protein n=1 Tax=Halosimplex carlsbadense 2-9-1 TaxID=797114 RepID=M0CNP5_9EURY|nr:hypothetical protein [Halosimplex carlsbadense]ELZ23484.1 hypothetical protein C475_14463 [Halosimplex carlsbadense 2-9-1]